MPHLRAADRRPGWPALAPLGAVLFLFLAAPVVPSWAGEKEAEMKGPAALTLEKKPIELLGGRLLIPVPAGMRVEARQQSIMAAPEASQDETRLVLDHAGVRLVVMAYELYARAGTDLLAAAQADLRVGWGKLAEACKLSALALPPPLQAVVNTPPRPDGKGAANLVLGVYVRSGDGLVQFLAFYVSPEGVAASEAWAELARRMAGGLAPGARKLALGAGTRKLAGLGGEGLTVEVPAGTSVSRQQGPDFVVHHLRPVALLGENGPTCGVYLGGHPGYQHRQQGVPPGEIRTEPGELLGRKVDYQRWAVAGRHVAEAIAPFEASGDDGHAHGPGLQVHAFCSAGSAEALAPLLGMLKTLKVDHGH